MDFPGAPGWLSCCGVLDFSSGGHQQLPVGYHLEAMSLKPFTYPFPETRFLHAGPNVYKFKIRYGNSIRGEEIEDKEVILKELEDSIRVVLGNLDNLQPFATEHFIVFPYKSKWERVSHLKFKYGEIVLAPYPFVFTLYVEMKWFHENPSPGAGRDESSRSHDEETSASGSTQPPAQARAGQFLPRQSGSLLKTVTMRKGDHIYVQLNPTHTQHSVWSHYQKAQDLRSPSILYKNTEKSSRE
ncbi:membrane-anchored junction protein isoform X6 [Acinonyx jubatus]|uniref:Membrane-anchored junction protein isoform X6 n=1 Tax=Acinonyx jubatus TaxID=32536 RepID=A0ABM3NHN6_ACIJB|nr:membrane-anchored junction protein isoform X6 [Acinonyx jubatus]